MAGLRVCDGLAQSSRQQCQGQGNVYDGVLEEQASGFHCDKNASDTECVLCPFKGVVLKVWCLGDHNWPPHSPTRN